MIDPEGTAARAPIWSPRAVLDPILDIEAPAVDVLVAESRRRPETRYDKAPVVAPGPLGGRFRVGARQN